METTMDSRTTPPWTSIMDEIKEKLKLLRVRPSFLAVMEQEFKAKMQKLPYVTAMSEDAQVAYVEVALWKNWWPRKPCPGFEIYEQLMEAAKPKDNAQSASTKGKGKAPAETPDTAEAVKSKDNAQSASIDGKGKAPAETSSTAEPVNGSLVSNPDNTADDDGFIEVSYAKMASKAKESKNGEGSSNTDPVDPIMASRLANQRASARIHGVRGEDAAYERMNNARLRFEKENPLELQSRFYEMFPLKEGHRVHSISVPPNEWWHFALFGSKKEGMRLEDVEKKFDVRFKKEYFRKAIFHVYVEPPKWGDFFRESNTIPQTKKLEKGLEFLKLWKWLNDRAQRDNKRCVWPINAYAVLREGNSPEAAEFRRQNTVLPEDRILAERAAAALAAKEGEGPPEFQYSWYTTRVNGEERVYRKTLTTAADEDGLDGKFNLNDINTELYEVDGELVGRFAKENCESEDEEDASSVTAEAGEERTRLYSDDNRNPDGSIRVWADESDSNEMPPVTTRKTKNKDEAPKAKEESENGEPATEIEQPSTPAIEAPVKTNEESELAESGAEVQWTQHQKPKFQQSSMKRPSWATTREGSKRLKLNNQKPQQD